MLKKFTLILLIFSSLILTFIFASSSSYSEGQKLDLKKSYEIYKKDYMSKDGRIMDPSRNNITTSEGQSYILFMSYTSNDKKTFDLAYSWTKNNLQRQDKLFSWIWGKSPEGKYKVLDYNSASDADIVIAFSLLAAHKQWKDKKYLNEAVSIISAIWEKETRRIGWGRILMPGAEQAKSEKIEVNPSYFAIYSFKIFQKFDKKHNWNKLVDSSYYYLLASMSKTKTGLPPNWFLIKNGKIVLEDGERSDFSYDAIRVFWRAYTDYKRTGDKRALAVLEKSKFFITQWKKTKNIYINYQSNGQLRDKNKSIGSIGILIPAIDLFDKKVAAEIYKKEVVPYFQEKGYWPSKSDYYGRNLLWFGQYMYTIKKPLE